MKNITKNTKTFLFASLLAAIILPFSVMDFADARKAPDMTDYESMYKEIVEQIHDNKKSIEYNQKLLQDISELSEDQLEFIEKQIQDKTKEVAELNKNGTEVQKLNIESYKLDSETQAIFDTAVKSIKGNYMDKYGVYSIDVENKYRKVLVFVDPDDFGNSNYAGGINAFVTELQDSVNVDVEVQVAKYIETHSTGCSTEFNPCKPAKGGIQISHQSTTGNGSTFGFKAYHPTHGYGFVIAGHEAVSVNTSIVQPKNGGSIGTVKVMGGGTCDCAFVKSTGGHTVYDQIWAPGVGSVYPVGVRNEAYTP